MKKFKALLFLPLFVLAINIHADNYCDPCKVEKPKCYDECQDQSKNKPYDQGHEICSDHLPKAYNAPGRIDVCGGWDTYVTGSFIYWQMLGDYTQIGILVEDGSAVPSVINKLDFDYKYKPGFKVGIGQHFDHDDWDLYGNYTRLVSNISFAHTFAPAEVLYSLAAALSPIGPAVLGSVAESFNTSWKRTLNQVDFEIARHYYMGTKVILRPYLGASAHWLKQNFDFYAIPPGASWGITTQYRSRSWAVGPRLGVNLQLLLGNGFKLFGNSAMTLSYAQTKTAGDFTDFLTGTNNHFRLEQDKDATVRFAPEALVGFAWATYFYNNRSHFDLSLGYEFHYYSHTNYFFEYLLEVGLPPTKPGDLYVHGLTVTARFDF